MLRLRPHPLPLPAGCNPFVMPVVDVILLTLVLRLMLPSGIHAALHHQLVLNIFHLDFINKSASGSITRSIVPKESRSAHKCAACISVALLMILMSLCTLSALSTTKLLTTSCHQLYDEYDVVIIVNIITDYILQ